MTLQPVYLVVGCPGSGKSWVCERLKERFTYVHHDLYIKMFGPVYVNEIFKAALTSKKPILAEAPFSISQIKDPLEKHGIRVVPVFIQEDPDVITERYLRREKRQIPKGHLTRQETYAQRARAWKAFSGTSDELLEHLKQIAAQAEGAR